MTTPTVQELPRKLEAVTQDPFGYDTEAAGDSSVDRVARMAGGATLTLVQGSGEGVQEPTVRDGAVPASVGQLSIAGATA